MAMEGCLDCHRVMSRLPKSGVQIVVEWCPDCFRVCLDGHGGVYRLP